MPLHLLGKKSWNVYSPANIARVKADEDAAAAREAAADQRTQDLDAARRAALLRGHTPPPLPADDAQDRPQDRRPPGGHDRKRPRLRHEDDTDMDIRLAAAMANPDGADAADRRLLKLRTPTSDAPLTDHAGHIDLFPVDFKAAMQREKNADAEREKRRKEQAFEDQYTMRFSNAGGKNGLLQPWYAAQHNQTPAVQDPAAAADDSGLESKNAWGNEDPRRKEREHARVSSNDPLAFMQKAQTQLDKAKEDRKKWARERNRELKDLRDAQDKNARRSRQHRGSTPRRSRSRSPDRDRKRRHAHRRSRSRSRSRDRHRHGDGRQGHGRHASSRHHKSRSPSSRRRPDQDERVDT